MGVKNNLKDLTGQTFGHLTVLYRSGTLKGYAVWRCRCSCGLETEARSDRLKDGHKKFCVVRRPGSDVSRSAVRASRVRGHELAYASWDQMRQRCGNPKHKGYKHYGARGIVVCERWNSFLLFLADMGDRPGVEFSIERVDVNGHYEPSNCKWGTDFERRRNKRHSIYVEWAGQRVFLADLCRERRVSYSKVNSRLKLGWSLSEAIDEVPRVRACVVNRSYDRRMGMRRKIQISLAIEPGLRDRLIAAAAADGRSVSAWVGRALEQLFAEMDRGWVRPDLGGLDRGGRTE